MNGARASWAGSPAAVAVALVAVALGLFIGGAPVVLLLWAVVILVARDPRAVPAAPLALTLLVGSALATVLESPLAFASVNLDYARDRSVAAATAHLAGVAVLVAVLTAAVAERAPAAAAVAPRRMPPASQDVVRVVRGALPVVAAVVAAVAVWVLLTPPTLHGTEGSVAANLQTGYGFTTGTGESAARVAATTAPLAPIVAAFSPAGLQTTALLVTIASVVAVICLARRAASNIRLSGAGSWAAPAVAGMLAGVVPAAAGQGLATSLTIALVAGGLMLAWPSAATPGRATLAGALLAGAALARPEAVVVIPLAAAWIATAARERAQLAAPRRLRAASATLLVAVAGLCLLPWHLWLSEHTGEWWAMPDLAGGGWWAWALPVTAALALGAATNHRLLAAETGRKEARSRCENGTG